MSAMSSAHVSIAVTWQPEDPSNEEARQHPQFFEDKSNQHEHPWTVCVYSSAQACSLHPRVRGGIGRSVS
jgi:hypothetical protein